MKLLVLSDLHGEGGGALVLPPGLEFDVSVLAGDLHSPGRDAVAWARQAAGISARPSVLVPGNHEFYGAPSFDAEMRAMARSAEGSEVHVLNRRSVVIKGVRFVGCILWTDFQLFVSVNGRREADVEGSLRIANARMADYRCIKVTASGGEATGERDAARLLRAEDTLAMHRLDRDWLLQELQKPFAGTTVVVTHHAPSAGSVAPQHDGDELSPAFASDLPEEFFSVPSLWIHGHTHSTANYVKGNCRVVSNPRGYRQATGEFENASFMPGWVVEVGAELGPADGSKGPPDAWDVPRWVQRKPA